MSVLDTVIGLIAPPVCVGCEIEGTTLCPACAATEITPYGERCFSCGAISPYARTCPRCSPGAPTYVWVSTNYERAARELVRLYKFGHQRAAGSSMSKLMVGTLAAFVSRESLQAQQYLVVPVPTATSRVRQRGFDHSALLADRIARKLGMERASVLLRLGQTRQVGAERRRRLSQLDGKFLVRNRKKVAGRNILLVDDVVTTGATLRAVTKALRAAGAARVDALVFAKRL